jgi:ribosome biogenesis protein Nip4
MRNAYKILVGNTDGKRRLERPRSRWEDNIRLNVWEIGMDVVNWIHLAQFSDRWWAVVNTVMNLQV